jgi:hypothetical protein
MKVSHFGGTAECKTIEDLRKVLNMRYGDGVNEFWISGEENNPCLAVLVNKDYANLTYFPKVGHMGFQSVGMGTSLVSDGISIFYTNTPEEEIEIGNDAVVPFFKALEAVEEFFETTALPESIEWFEL